MAYCLFFLRELIKVFLDLMTENSSFRVMLFGCRQRSQCNAFYKKLKVTRLSRHGILGYVIRSYNRFSSLRYLPAFQRTLLPACCNWRWRYQTSPKDSCSNAGLLGSINKKTSHIFCHLLFSLPINIFLIVWITRLRMTDAGLETTF